MVTHTVRDGFDQNGTLFFQDQLTSLLGGVVNSEEIVTIYSDGWHSICDSSNHDAISGVLVIDGR